MDPDRAIHVPEKQDVASEFIYPLTTDHLRRFGIPFGVLFLFILLFPLPGSTTILLVGVGAVLGGFSAFGRVQGVPVDQWLRGVVRYASRPRAFSSRAGATGAVASREFLKVQALEAGHIVTSVSQGWATYATVCRVTPPNFLMMRPEEKAAALDAFQSVLSSTEVSIQVLSRAQPYDLEPYFRGYHPALRSQPNGKLRRLTLEFLDWFEKFDKRHRVLRREFYFILSTRAPSNQDNQPLPPALQSKKNHALRGLDSAAQNAVHQLTGAGATAEILGNAASLELLQSCLNPSTFSQQSQLHKALTTPAAAPSQLSQLRIPDVAIRSDHLQLGQDFVRTLTIRHYPDRVPVAWLQEILALDQRLVLSIHYEPKPSWRVLKRLKHSKIALRQNIHSKEKKGYDATDDRQHLDALDDQIRAVAGRQTTYFEVTVWISAHAPTKRELDQATQEIQHHLRNLSMTPFSEHWTQRDAFESTLPLGINRLPTYSQTMDTPCAAATYPFVTSNIHHDAGTLVGMHAQTGSPYILDRWSYINHNRIIAGTSGAGKSFTIKLDMERTLLRRPNALLFVVDPLREFTDITQALGGQVVYVGNPQTRLNPFEVAEGASTRPNADGGENAYRRKMAFLEALFQLVLPGLTRLEASTLHLAIQDLYRTQGIQHDPSTHHHTPPTLTQLVDHLHKESQTAQDPETARVARSLHTYLLPLLQGPLSCLDGQTNVQLESNVLCFDLESLDKNYFPTFMFVVLDLIERRILADLERPKVIYIDESWRLLQEPCTAKPLSQLSRHVRHYKCGIDFITQTPDSFFQNEHGEAIHSNCLVSLLFRQRSINQRTRAGFGLSDREAEFLTRLGQAKNMDHSEALLITGDDKAFLSIYSSPQEYQLVTTKPDDLVAKRAAQPPKVEVAA